MTKHEVIEEVNKSNNNFKSEAMSIFEDFIEQGIEQGIEKGIAKEKQESIIRGWKSGISVSLIANVTGSSIAEVEKVIADYEAKS